MDDMTRCVSVEKVLTEMCKVPLAILLSRSQSLSTGFAAHGIICLSLGPRGPRGGFYFSYFAVVSRLVMGLFYFGQSSPFSRAFFF